MVRTATSTFLGGALAALSLLSLAASDNGCQTLNGNTYCKEVDHIKYENIGASGLGYSDVVKMDPNGCVCKKSELTYSGPLAPLDSELSLHFRGPLHLKQFAVYYPGGVVKRHNRHHHGHSLLEPHHKRSTTWKRTGYYNAGKGEANGIVFMNHKGGQASGVWDQCWGNSISFSDSSCSKDVAKPEVLADMTVPSDVEFLIFTDKECDGECGAYRPGIPAYKGFSGKQKIFLFEFTMPEDHSSSNNDNMPSIWALNARIPRTSQYSDCSCWGSGCGELDMFEVLEGGTDYVKSHFHARQGGTMNKGGGGSPDFFKRPFDKPVKAAVIFDPSGTVDIKLLNDDVQFGETLDNGVLNYEGKEVSKFVVPN